ncbi:DNA-methyltransferase [Lonepinella sp. BR2271]|uniref:DNA-methyltransferase n=1 Tax=Lonepinella sp. BR2271 TaxID=3434550 RepID=UPI003F6E2400
MNNQIICGNSLEEIKKIPDQSIHAIISDIPYGIGYDDWDVLHKNTNSALGGQSQAQINAGGLFKRRGKPLNGWSEADKKIPLEYQQWCENWAKDWLRVLKPGASCFIFAGRRFAHRCIVALENSGFTFKDMIAWEKTKAPHRAQRVSAIFERREDIENTQKWQGWRVANLRPVFEPILWFQKPYKVGGTLADNIVEYGLGAWNENALDKSLYDAMPYANIIKVASNSDDTGKHITQKPLQLMEILVSLVTSEGQIVLDPFAGSGTVCVAANNLNRQYIGIEADDHYVDIAKSRLIEQRQSTLFN